MVATSLLPALPSNVAQSHYCPSCLKRVDVADATRRAHREACPSGVVDVCLLQCPTCDIVLAAIIEPELISGALVAPNV